MMTTFLRRCSKPALIFFGLCYFLTNAFSQQVNIIPYPQGIQKKAGDFTITADTKIVYDKADSKELSTALAPLTLKLQSAAGIMLKTTSRRQNKNFIEVV